MIMIEKNRSENEFKLENLLGMIMMIKESRKENKELFRKIYLFKFKMYLG